MLHSQVDGKADEGRVFHDQLLPVRKNMEKNKLPKEANGHEITKPRSLQAIALQKLCLVILEVTNHLHRQVEETDETATGATGATGPRLCSSFENSMLKSGILSSVVKQYIRHTAEIAKRCKSVMWISKQGATIQLCLPNQEGTFHGQG